jgi:hypothetical protein
MSERRMTYSFGPLERRGILGPVSVGQAGVLATGAIAAIVVLDQSPSASGALLAIILIAVAAGATFAPLAGRTVSEWAPLAAGFAARRISRRADFRSVAATAGTVARGVGRRDPQLRDPAAVAPQPLHKVRIVSAAYRERAIGALSERSGRRLTAVWRAGSRRSRCSTTRLRSGAWRVGGWCSPAPVGLRSGACSGSSGPPRLRAMSLPAGSTPSVIPRYRCVGHR